MKKTTIVNGFRITYDDKNAETLKNLFGKNIEEEAREILKDKKAKEKKKK